MNKITLPELGDGIEKATVACWNFKVGDPIKAEDDIVELVTDKASFQVPAGCRGTLKQIMVPEGTEAKIGQVLAVVGP